MVRGGTCRRTGCMAASVQTRCVTTPLRSRPLSRVHVSVSVCLLSAARARSVLSRGLEYCVRGGLRSALGSSRSHARRRCCCCCACAAASRRSIERAQVEKSALARVSFSSARAVSSLLSRLRSRFSRTYVGNQASKWICGCVCVRSRGRRRPGEQQRAREGVQASTERRDRVWSNEEQRARASEPQHVARSSKFALTPGYDVPRTRRLYAAKNTRRSVCATSIQTARQRGAVRSLPIPYSKTTHGNGFYCRLSGKTLREIERASASQQHAQLAAHAHVRLSSAGDSKWRASSYARVRLCCLAKKPVARGRVVEL